MKPKFKYILSPENLYIIDYDNFQAEILGSQIMDILLKEYYMDFIPENQSSEDDSTIG